jgi:hypothetical protein
MCSFYCAVKLGCTKKMNILEEELNLSLDSTNIGFLSNTSNQKQGQTWAKSLRSNSLKKTSDTLKKERRKATKMALWHRRRFFSSKCCLFLFKSCPIRKKTSKRRLLDVFFMSFLSLQCVFFLSTISKKKTPKISEFYQRL